MTRFPPVGPFLGFCFLLLAIATPAFADYHPDEQGLLDSAKTLPLPDFMAMILSESPDSDPTFKVRLEEYIQDWRRVPGAWGVRNASRDAMRDSINILLGIRSSSTGEISFETKLRNWMLVSPKEAASLVNGLFTAGSPSTPRVFAAMPESEREEILKSWLRETTPESNPYMLLIRKVVRPEQFAQAFQSDPLVLIEALSKISDGKFTEPNIEYRRRYRLIAKARLVDLLNLKESIAAEAREPLMKAIKRGYLGVLTEIRDDFRARSRQPSHFDKEAFQAAVKYYQTNSIDDSELQAKLDSIGDSKQTAQSYFRDVPTGRDRILRWIRGSEFRGFGIHHALEGLSAVGKIDEANQLASEWVNESLTAIENAARSVLEGEHSPDNLATILDTIGALDQIYDFRNSGFIGNDPRYRDRLQQLINSLIKRGFEEAQTPEDVFHLLDFQTGNRSGIMIWRGEEALRNIDHFARMGPTDEELVKYLDKTYGFHTPWPAELARSPLPENLSAPERMLAYLKINKAHNRDYDFDPKNEVFFKKTMEALQKFFSNYPDIANERAEYDSLVPRRYRTSSRFQAAPLSESVPTQVAPVATEVAPPAFAIEQGFCTKLITKLRNFLPRRNRKT